MQARALGAKLVPTLVAAALAADKDERDAAARKVRLHLLSQSKSTEQKQRTEKKTSEAYSGGALPGRRGRGTATRRTAALGTLYVVSKNIILSV